MARSDTERTVKSITDLSGKSVITVYSKDARSVHNLNYSTHSDASFSEPVELVVTASGWTVSYSFRSSVRCSSKKVRKRFKYC